MNPTSMECSSCCHQDNDMQKAEYKKHSLIEVLEKISALALGIFAAYVNLKLFAAFAVIGVGIGIYNYCAAIKGRYGQPTSPCAQSFLEHLTGIKLPATISLFSNLAITAVHIEHHSEVFVPIVGLMMGAWMGQNGAYYGSLLFRKFQSISGSKKSLPACC